MRYLYICNTSSDSISKVNVDDFNKEKEIKLGQDINSNIGPHGICVYNFSLISVNSFGNSISILSKDEEEESHFIGAHCNDIGIMNNNAYIICGDSNSIIVFDLMKKRIVEQIPCGSMPHSINIDYKNKRMVTANMYSDSITIIDGKKLENIKEIRVGPYPTKAIFSRDGQLIIVCESNIGGYLGGSISIFSSQSFKLINSVQVGFSPVDIYCDGEYIYVSNLGEGSISIVSINGLKVIKNINVGGMPRGIIKIGQYIYVGDNYNNLLLRVDLKNDEIKKAIALGGEPTGMALV